MLAQPGPAVILIWITGAQPAQALGTPWWVAAIVGLALAQYRWDYLARVTASTYQTIGSE